jgi:Spy/CpxP family protein refolding chaperone
MTNRAHGLQIPRLGRSGPALLLALTAVLLLTGSRPALAEPPAAAPGPLPALDRRITLLAKELDLSEAQQVAMRKLLLEQREKVTRLWNESAIPAQDRIRATQLIGDQTADRIRDLLTEAQRKKYNQPRTKRPGTPGDQPRSVEEWMQSTRAATQPPSATVP